MEKLLAFTPVELILGSVTCVLFIVQLLYWIVSYARPIRQAGRQQPADSFEQLPVSIIVYAKNESENLHTHLPALLTQEYPNYEVIVVNDGSTDESDEVLKRFEQDHKHLYHTYIPEGAKHLSRKKLALTVGVKAAKHDILLFTEADSQPLSLFWIASMVCRYTPATDIVLGFCAYGDHKGFLHKLIAYDNLISGLQSISSALVRRPYTGTGRNLSYRKQFFFRNQGYSRSLNLHAGDDDLFINEYAGKKNAEVAYFTDSITELAKIDCFKVWKEMKVSRAATQQHYKGYSLSFYRFEDITFFLFLAAVIATVVIGVQGNWLLAVLSGLLYLIRLTTKAIILHKSARLLRQKSTVTSVILCEIVRPLFNQYVRIYRIFWGKNDYTFHI